MYSVEINFTYTLHEVLKINEQFQLRNFFKIYALPFVSFYFQYNEAFLNPHFKTFYSISVTKFRVTVCLSMLGEQNY